MRTYKYEEILGEEVLNKFTDKQREKISELILGQDYGFFIDVKKICEILGIAIEEGKLFDNLDINDSGKYIAETKTILFNPIEHGNRRRFTIAHELGHAVFNHSGESFRTQIPEKYNDVISKMNETAANNFAAQLLMPVKLIEILMLESINKHEYNSELLSSEELKVIISEVAKELKVSEIALNYSIKNNGLIKEDLV
ncbi:ImmA/IrrE family metallo-endopeptidase [Staphylococcus aureus]|uniref:ImmA/IrrE family metallo-endopeptidase n=1 Tax=Staphylococcus aureus TaxID=1280 RepID=UPI001CC4AE1D|nr:ImmA/IrrE family metallo-endopeptidase [Staphylococcus aureus]